MFICSMYIHHTQALSLGEALAVGQERARAFCKHLETHLRIDSSPRPALVPGRRACSYALIICACCKTYVFVCAYVRACVRACLCVWVGVLSIHSHANIHGCSGKTCHKSVEARHDCVASHCEICFSKPLRASSIVFTIPVTSQPRHPTLNLPRHARRQLSKAAHSHTAVQKRTAARA